MRLGKEWSSIMKRSGGSMVVIEGGSGMICAILQRFAIIGFEQRISMKLKTFLNNITIMKGIVPTLVWMRNNAFFRIIIWLVLRIRCSSFLRNQSGSLYRKDVRDIMFPFFLFLWNKGIKTFHRRERLSKQNVSSKSWKWFVQPIEKLHYSILLDEVKGRFDSPTWTRWERGKGWLLIP